MLELKVKKNFFIQALTDLRLAVLAARHFRKPGGMIDALVNDAWEKAKAEGLVSEAMFEQAPVSDESSVESA
jgi:hypothetical protein